MTTTVSVRVNTTDLRTVRRMHPRTAIPTLFAAMVGVWRGLTADQRREAMANVLLNGAEKGVKSGAAS